MTNVPRVVLCRDDVLEEAIHAIGELDGGDPERDKALEDAMRTVSALKSGSASNVSRQDERGLPRPERPAPPMPPVQSMKGETEPVCYLRTLHGKPDWAEDCVGDPDVVMNGYEESEGYDAMPLYAHPPRDVEPVVSRPTDEVAIQESSCPACGCKETEIHFDGTTLFLHCLGCLSDTSGWPLIDANAALARAGSAPEGHRP